MRRPTKFSIQLIALFVPVLSLPAADNVIFPADAGVLDVKTFGAIGDGRADDTAAIQTALNARSNGNTIVFLPNGTYRIRNQLSWPGTNGGTTIGKRTILQGQSRLGTVIRFDNPAVTTGAVIDTGDGAAQNFRNAVRDLTVAIAPGNAPTLDGLRFISNNQGCVRNVRIIAEDGRGGSGLQLAQGENGPLLVDGVEVIGFDIGISAANTVASQTLEHVRLSGQRVLGIKVANQTLFIRDLVSRNAVTVLQTFRDSQAYVCVVDAWLSGEGAAASLPAIFSDKSGFYRNIMTSGYARAIRHDDKGRGNIAGVPGPYAEEFLTHGAARSGLPGSASTSLNLELRTSPEVAWDAPSAWDGPHRHGGRLTDQLDDTAAVQAAANSGAATVYLPNTNGGRWQINGDLFIPAGVHRIIGGEALIEGNGRIVVGPGTTPLVIERLAFGLASPLVIEHAGNRPLVLSSLLAARYRPGAAPGDVYIEDVCFQTPPTFRDQRVWARQFNQETDTQGSVFAAKALCDHASLWVFGIKTERAGTIVATRRGGSTEILGGFIYATTSVVKTDPAFTVEDSRVSIAGVVGKSFGTPLHTVFVRETRNGTTADTTTWNSLQVSAPALANPAPPMARADAATGLRDADLIIDVLANDTDADSDALAICGLTSGQHGVARTDGRHVVYHPDSGFTGTDTLHYRISDGRGGTAHAEVRLTIAAQAAAPVFREGATATLAVIEDTPGSLVLHASAADGGALEWSVAGQGSKGMASISGSGWERTIGYAPAADRNGSDAFIIQVVDGLGNRARITIQVAISAVNDAPIFRIGPDQTVLAHAGLRTFPAWASAISPGPADESGQKLAFTVTTTNPQLFKVPPAIAADGTLTFESSGVPGMATVTVILIDDGGTANGGVNRSLSQDFRITIISATVAPEFIAATGFAVSASDALHGRDCVPSRPLLTDGLATASWWNSSGEAVWDLGLANATTRHLDSVVISMGSDKSRQSYAGSIAISLDGSTWTVVGAHAEQAKAGLYTRVRYVFPRELAVGWRYLKFTKATIPGGIPWRCVEVDAWISDTALPLAVPTPLPLTSRG